MTKHSRRILKPPVYYHDLEQGTEEWHKIRSGLITASTFSRLITTRTFQPANNETSRKLCHQILAERLTGIVEETYQSDAMLRGSMEEDIARQLYTEHRQEVRKCGFVTRQNRGVTIGYSPDGLVGNHGLIEIKRPKQENQIARILADKIPDEYFWQIHEGLAVTGRRWCDFVSYAPNLPLMIYRVRASPEINTAIWNAAIAAENSIKEMEKQIRMLAKTRKYPPTKPLITVTATPWD
jgi:putative phage-type endonuclease